MAFFNRKKKQSEPEDDKDLEGKDETNPSEMSDDDFAAYIDRRRSGEPDPEDEEPPEAEEPEDETPPEDEPSDEEPPAEEAAESDDESEPAEEEPPAEETPPPFKSFATEAEYKADIDKAIAAAKGKWDLDHDADIKRYRRMSAISKGFYPDDDTSLDKLGDELEGQLADRDGITREEYLRRRDMKDKADKWDAQETGKADVAAKQKAIVDKWVADAGNLKIVFPDFSLEDALQKPEFTNALKTGADVFSAYAQAYQNNPDPEPDVKPEAAEDQAEDQAEEPKEESEDKPEREPIPQNGQGKRGGTGGGQNDPSKLSSADFKKYIDKIRNS